MTVYGVRFTDYEVRTKDQGLWTRNRELGTDAESSCPPIWNPQSTIWNAYGRAGMSN